VPAARPALPSHLGRRPAPPPPRRPFRVNPLALSVVEGPPRLSSDCPYSVISAFLPKGNLLTNSWGGVAGWTQEISSSTWSGYSLKGAWKLEA